MARITVQDCLQHVENRFSLVLISAERTKQLLKGAEPKVEHSHGNKEVVTALREIGAGLIRYHEKDPEEVPPEVIAADIKKAVQMRDSATEQGEVAGSQVLGPDNIDGDDFDEAELDGLDQLPDDELDE